MMNLKRPPFRNPVIELESPQRAELERLINRRDDLRSVLPFTTSLSLVIMLGCYWLSFVRTSLAAQLAARTDMVPDLLKMFVLYGPFVALGLLAVGVIAHFMSWPIQDKIYDLDSEIRRAEDARREPRVKRRKWFR